MDMPYLGARLRDEFSTIIVHARMDLAHYIDTFEVAPPAMFSSLYHLACWIETNKLAVEAVPGSAGNICRVHGSFDEVHRVPSRL